MEELGPAFGEMYGRGVSKAGLSGLGSDIAGAAIDHPKMATLLGGGILPAAAGAGTSLAAGKADEMLPDEEMPPELENAITAGGGDPSEYGAGHRMPFEGATTGASIGMLANSLGKKGQLAKYLAIGGLLGGGLGAAAKVYPKKDEETNDALAMRHRQRRGGI